MIGLALCCSVAGHAADKSVSTIAENEVRRREALVTTRRGSRLVEADALLKAGKSEEAVNAYSQIYQSLPKAAMAAAMRDHARAGFAAASCNRARELMAEARYAEAMQLLDNVLSPDVDPDHEMARKLRKQFQDPDRYPTALTPQHISKVKEVQRLLELANSALEIGDYDKSIKVYEEVIRLDLYNKSARRGMERVEQKRSEYFDSARDHTRKAARRHRQRMGAAGASFRRHERALRRRKRHPHKRAERS